MFLINVVGWEKYMQKIVHRKLRIRRKENWDSVNPQGGFAPTLWFARNSKLPHITVTAEFKDQPVLICKTYNCIQLFILVAWHLIQESNESPSSNHSIHSCRSSVASRCINLSSMTAARQWRTPPFLNRSIEGELLRAWVQRRPQVHQLIYCHEF